MARTTKGTKATKAPEACKGNGSVTLMERDMYPFLDKEGNPTGLFIARMEKGWAILVSDATKWASHSGNPCFGSPAFLSMPSPFKPNENVGLKVILAETPVKEAKTKETKPAKPNFSLF